ncbi:uncharacterized protein LOC119320177 [Triticum dicoccoides]|uniref:uncharacterized protein LOC119320177 n=1 Tax=Triticum dicoccoides TaxID=85692 RepID=UPI001891A3E1|nr:uncharacterized protein LOC119320177 [Triticum dicoccoides]
MAERGPAAASRRRPRRRRPGETLDHQHPRPSSSLKIPSWSHTNPCSTTAQTPHPSHLNACRTVVPTTTNPSWGSKRVRTASNRNPLHDPDANNCRDWASLGEGPAGLIADFVLANDVADYVRFRAVCGPWRRCCTDPRGHGALDRRFHPRRWVMLREKLAYARRFLNVSTGECIQTEILELREHDELGLTPEGLIILLHGPSRTHVRLLNPLTRQQLTDLPPLTTLLPPERHSDLLPDRDFPLRAWGSGIAADDSSVVLCFNSRCILGIAKPGDERWTVVRYKNSVHTAPLMFAGRFYCTTENGILLLETSADQPPRMEVAARLQKPISAMIMDSAHLVNNDGELMLVHRTLRYLRNRSRRRTYDVYKVDLETGTLLPVMSLGGRALFMGFYCSLSVSVDSFPSISGDTIYLSFDFKEGVHDEEIEACHLPKRSTKSAHYNLDSSVPWPHKVVPTPHTLIDCLSLCNTVEASPKHVALVI